MAAQFCTQKLNELQQLVHGHGTFTLTLCVLELVFSLLATTGNLLVIRALWKASTIPGNMKRLFLSLAFSDLALGLIAQLAFVVINTVMLKMAANGNFDFDFFCPTILNAAYFLSSLLACASFLNVTAIAVDRLLAVSLHLRYQQLITSKRVVFSLVSLWLTSGVAALIYISFPNHNNLGVVAIEFTGLFLTTVAYVRIYKVVRHHQNQIHSLLQLSNVQAREQLQEKKSAYNALLVYVVFVACYLPYLCYVMVLIINNFRTSFLVTEQVLEFLLFLNSSLNPFVNCWRYREIRENVKRTVKNMVSINNTET